jgi:hypothetical protein
MLIFMHSLHDVHEINVCLFVHMIQLDKCWTDLDEILYGRYAIGDYPEIVLFNFL